MTDSLSADPVRDLVRTRAASLRLSLAEISQKIGRNHAYLQQFLERGVPREIPERLRPLLAAALGVTETELRAPDNIVLRRFAPATVAMARPDEASPARDLPIYASAQGGPSGMLVTPEPIDWTPRPRPLQHVANAFGIYVVGDSMAPAYRHGDMVFVHPSLPPLRGDDVLLTKHRADREMVAMVKQLQGWNERHWRLKQWNPAREFHASRQEWQQAQVIVGKYNRR